MRYALLAIAAGLAATLVPCAVQSKVLDFSSVRTIVGLADPQLSPDGKSVALIVSRANFDKDRYERDLVLVDVATGSQRTLTYGRRGLGSPRWSPTGDRLAFVALAGDGDDAATQIYVMPMNGGDPAPITKTAHGVEQFAWRPDGSAIAFVTADDPPNKSAIEKHHDAFVVGDNDYLQRSAAVPSHVWIVNSDGGGARRLTSGTWSVPSSEPPGPPGSPLSWTPDGKYLAITRLESPIYGDSDQSTVELVDAATGTARKLTSHGMFESFPEFAPDGRNVAYWYPREGDPTNINAIWVAPASGGDGSDVTHELDRHIVRAIWMPDGQTLLVAAHDGTRAAMWIQPLAGPAKRIDTGDVNPVQAFWLDACVGKDGAIAFTGSEPNRPNELWYMASPDTAPKRLTNFNDSIASLDLGRVEGIDWQGPDGYAEDGVLTYPPGFSSAKKYPLVLVIHGGPNSASTTAFSAFSQLLAARGWVVFSPNYRGSDNFGNAYWRGIFNDAGDGPGRDVMAGIAAVEKLGFVDPSRIGVSGWSYGGYMTSWMIGHYNIWKAAVSGAAVNNLVDEYDLSDNNVGVRYGFPGFVSPWKGSALKAYLDQSPITYAQNVKTPTLILGDIGDARVPITQSFEMYHALKDNGVRTDFWEYPVAGHSPGDPMRSEDVNRRWIGWFAEYLK